MIKQINFIAASITTIFVLGSISTSHSAVLAFDNFNSYTIDGTIDGANAGSGFNGGYYSSSPSFGYLHTARNATPLSYANYPAVGSTYLNFAGGFGGPAYMDVQRLLDVTTAFSAYNSGGVIGADNTTLWGSFAYRTDTGTGNFMLFGGAANTYFTLPVNGNASSLYVFKINYGASNADTISFWNNPNLASFDGTQTPTSTQSGDWSFTTVGWAVNGDTFQNAVDNVTFGSTVGDVVPIAVPEPSTLVMLSFAGLGLVFLRTKSRHLAS